MEDATGANGKPSTGITVDTTARTLTFSGKELKGTGTAGCGAEPHLPARR